MIKNNTNKKYRFVIVGSGWRSLYYVRIAKALPDVFELCAMLCRTKEKAQLLAAEYDIYTTTSIEECRQMNPDFVIVAVNKASIAAVSMEWMNYGCTVLCETPAALNVDELAALWTLHCNGGRLMVAEQYTEYPMYKSQLAMLRRGIIGQPQYLHISLAHEYHGAGLMRAYLGVGEAESFSVSAKTYAFPTVETVTRYEHYKDGRVADKKRTIATFEFACGKVALYEFDSEQYRSTIRNNYVKVQGVRGEMKDNEFVWLDENYETKRANLTANVRRFTRDSDNPNLKRDYQCCEIYFTGEEAEGELVYEMPYKIADLSEDETAIASLMSMAGAYDTDVAANNLRGALQDAYMTILLQQAIDTGDVITSEKQIWN